MLIFFFEDVRALGAWRPCPPDSFANLRFAVYWAKGVGGNFTCFFIVCRKAVPKKGVSDGGLRGCADFLDFVPVGQPSSFGNCIGQKQDIKSQ